MEKLFHLLLTTILLFNCKLSVFGAWIRDDLINDFNDVPPPITEYAKTARYLVYRSDWISMGTLSTHPKLKGFPMVNIISIADSERNSPSTGEIYFYLTMKDFTAQDLSRNNRLTGMITLDQDLYCTKKSVDSMEPTCSRVMISGTATRLKNNTADYEFGKKAMINRHPAVLNWINATDHRFFLCKLDIQEIIVLDYYGGPKFVTVDDYYKANLDNENLNNLSFYDSNYLDDNMRNKQKKDINIKFNKKDINTINIHFN